MKKLHWLGVAGAVAVVVTTAAYAANISNLSGQSCGAFTGTWHFVNNQTGGAAPGQLMATWSSGDSCVVSASKVSGSNQHFNCTASGTLLSASTNLPGKLVLSDFSCSTKEPPPPPPCDPKKDPYCK
ncbi:MAG: hypothetical protein KIT17_22445 [Rubrivivax sp.]|nr:hypothetical protein [Rubrivivax sp.]